MTTQPKPEGAAKPANLRIYPRALALQVLAELDPGFSSPLLEAAKERMAVRTDNALALAETAPA